MSETTTTVAPEIVTIECSVTQEFIDDCCHNASNCPIARALIAAFPGANVASAASSGFNVYKVPEGQEYPYPQDQIAAGYFFNPDAKYGTEDWDVVASPGAFIHDYDSHMQVKPFTFKLRGVMGQGNWRVVTDA